MQKVYVEAFYEDNTQCLGNLDGQSVLKAKDYKRTNHYKMLKRGHFKPLKKIKYWAVISPNEKILEYIPNIHFKNN